MSVSKTIRVNESILEELEGMGKAYNFSQTSNSALRDYLKRRVWIPNLDIHDYANLDPATFYSRMTEVMYLRCSEALMFTFYPTSTDDLEVNEKLFQYANGNYNFVNDSYVFFNIEYPQSLFHFLKSRPMAEVNRAIHGFLACLYWLDDDEKKTIMETQLEKSTLKSVISIVQGVNFQELEEIKSRAIHNPRLKIEYNDKYREVLTKLGIDSSIFPLVDPIIQVLQYPFRYSDKVTFDSNGFDVKLTSAYMRNLYGSKDDWESIIIHGSNFSDNLHRAESHKLPLSEWRSLYHYFNIIDIESIKIFEE